MCENTDFTSCKRRIPCVECHSEVHVVMWPVKSSLLPTLNIPYGLNICYLIRLFFPMQSTFLNGDLLSCLKMASAVSHRRVGPYHTHTLNSWVGTPAVSYSFSSFISHGDKRWRRTEAAAPLPILAVARPLSPPTVVLFATTQRFTACLNDIH